MNPNERDVPDQPGTVASSGGEASGRRAVADLLGDRYEILGRLGAGTFGEVYEATDTTLHRKVAIKRIRLDAFAEGPELEEVKVRFLREAQVAAKLRHPNIVTVHDIAAKGANSFMVMELVEGQTLQALLLEKGRLGVEETLRIVAPVAAALDYAHANGVVHRDVKPGNLMIEPSGHVKVMDFGIAKQSSGRSSGNITRSGTILGTPNYMAPEQARGGSVDGRADLFSLGCILYECLTGLRPFTGENVTAILLKIVNEAPPAIDFAALKLPGSLEPVLRNALAKDPQERYPTGESLTAAARDATLTTLSSVPPPLPATFVPGQGARPTPPPPPPPLTRKRGSGWKMVAGLAAAAAVAALLWTVSASQRAQGTATTGATGAQAGRVVRLSPHVTKDEPPLVKRLLGAKPTLHVTAPEGSSVGVRLDTALSSESARPDQVFTATTDAPVVVDGYEVVPAGSRVTGRVLHAAPAGKVSGRGELTLEFDRIVVPGRAETPISTEPLRWVARSTVKKDAAKVGGGAVIGAVVGGLLGGKKGVAIGGAVGGSAGAGVVLATKGEEVVLRQGSRLDVRLRSPLTVTLAAPEK